MERAGFRGFRECCENDAPTLTYIGPFPGSTANETNAEFRISNTESGIIETNGARPASLRESVAGVAALRAGMPNEANVPPSPRLRRGRRMANGEVRMKANGGCRSFD
jgi:hypothetical protein